MKGRKFSWQAIVHIIFKILSWALFIILLLIAIFLLYYYIANKIYVKNGPGYEPKFSIYTIAYNFLKYKIISSFRSSNPTNINMTVTHRIKAITKDSDGNACYVTKGDANPIEDEVCAKYKNVIGKVIIRIPGVGHIQRFLASGIGWMLFILIPALIIIGKDIMKITKLSSIKENANKMTDKKRKDPKKEAAEKKRKEEIKRKLLNENKGTKE